jgi:hypothetical protein
MLRNQQRQLQLDEQVSSAAVQFFSVMTSYLDKLNSTVQPQTDSKSSTSKDNTVPSSPGGSKLPPDPEPNSEARTTQRSDSDIPETTREAKRLCTTEISENNLRCDGISSKVIVLSQEGERKLLKM